MAGAILLIGGWNLAIFGDFVHKGWTQGNDVGATGRYVAARQGDPDYRFYLAASAAYPYFGLGGTPTIGKAGSNFLPDGNKR